MVYSIAGRIYNLVPADQEYDFTIKNPSSFKNYLLTSCDMKVHKRVMHSLQFFKLWNCWKIWIGKFRKTVHTSGWPRAINKARISLSIKTDSLRVATWKLQSKTRAKPSTAWSTLQWGPRSDWIRWLEPLAISCRAMKKKFYVQENNSGRSRHSSMYMWHIRPCNTNINYTGLEPDMSMNSLLFMKYHRPLFVFRPLTNFGIPSTLW